MRVSKLDNNLTIRFMTSFVLIPFVIGSIVFSSLLVQIILVIVAIGMFIEWYNMTRPNYIYMAFGIPIISIPIASLLIITIVIPHYKCVLLTYLVMIWTVDTLAMFGGKIIGGIKLAPKLSPNKTWSGLLCGVIGSVVVGNIISFFPEFEFPYQGLSLSFFALLLGFMAQISDLFISFFKRKFHLKDSGNIIPGHGGILDRIDSLILTAPILLYVAL